MAAQQVRTASAPGSGVLLSGGVPPLADTYFTRAESGLDLASSLRPGETVVLVHGAETDVAPAAQGGTGKTQLAVEFAHVMWNTRAVEILVWVSAASRESVITGFAQAANTVDASQPDEGAEIAAVLMEDLIEARAGAIEVGGGEGGQAARSTKKGQKWS